MLTAHLLLTAGKKMSLDKSLQIPAESSKIILNPESVTTTCYVPTQMEAKQLNLHKLSLQL